ncbi:hypothetical protein [Seohaeicola zhoushanensis]|uniref:Uncharacterized protein n=1 Tax=Seohaeicola zhoushanensis TaxID=1569283 RepID=A0A8J3H0D9_9RHOB|nr:hypothetical protein [Seohaeicola zhoushanensis]GHF67643.1 hypothetical protein GCM10017056_43510 [Seohaeicola zhoushanensis]
MSEPVTNVDIEDVLSSIRRLVADESRAPVRRIKLQPSQAIRTGDSSSTAATRLLLTPSLRVNKEDAGQADTASVHDRFGRLAGADDIQFRKAPMREPWRDPKATLLGAAAHPVAEEPEEPKAATSLRVPLILSGALKPAEEEETPEIEAEADVAEAEAVDPEAVAEDVEAAAEPVVAEEPAVTAPEIVAEPEAPVAETADLQARGGGLETKIAALEARMAAAPKAEAVDLEARGNSLKSKIAALEAAIAQTPGPWEPDGSGMDDHDAAPIKTAPWEGAAALVDAVEEDGPADDGFLLDMDGDEAFEADDEVEAEEPVMQTVEEAVASAVEELVTEVAARVVEDETSVAEVEEPVTKVEEPVAEEPEVPASGKTSEAVAGGEDSFLDEDSLRELVAEIVREELQGALGERITRNVRKLVRLEIQRALAAHGLN